MWRPDIRQRHLEALAKNPINFKGGNGQPTIPIVAAYAEVLIPLDYVQELPIPTAGHGTEHKPPNSYKADFGHPELKIAIELDGQSHRPRERQAQDRKKTEVLEALGWKVIRVRHD